MHGSRIRRGWTALALLTLACASAPPAPAPGRGTVFGELRLAPHPGVTMPSANDPSYADPRMRDTRLVDYSKPGFAVVYLDGPPAPGERAELAIRANQFETRLEPRWVAVAAGGTVSVRNASDEPHTVSCPSLGKVVKLAPGDAVELSASLEGAQSVFLLDRPQVESGFFAAPGPYAVLTQSPYFELRDLPPGTIALHAWHPRLPPLERSVDVVAGQSTRVDLVMGVGVADAEGASR
jgi:hypothetical protein